jgi:hypothetical protein
VFVLCDTVVTLHCGKKATHGAEAVTDPLCPVVRTAPAVKLISFFCAEARTGRKQHSTISFFKVFLRDGQQLVSRTLIRNFLAELVRRAAIYV